MWCCCKVRVVYVSSFIYYISTKIGKLRLTNYQVLKRCIFLKWTFCSEAEVNFCSRCVMLVRLCSKAETTWTWKENTSKHRLQTRQDRLPADRTAIKKHELRIFPFQMYTGARRASRSGECRVRRDERERRLL